VEELLYCMANDEVRPPVTRKDGVVKVFEDGRGHSYSDMPWEPKVGFPPSQTAISIWRKSGHPNRIWGPRRSALWTCWLGRRGNIHL